MGDISNRNNPSQDSGPDLEIVVGFYINGESFDNKLIDDDISDTLGLNNEKFQFYYLVDYSGQGNTEFFTGANYSRQYLNISLIMPYDSTELNLGEASTLSGFSGFISDIEAKYHCIIIWGHGKGSEGLCFDGNKYLNGEEVRDSLFGKKFDLIVFDACEMMCHEFLSDIQDLNTLVLGSEKDIPDRGIDYAGGFSSFIRSGSSSIDQLGRDLIDSTVDFYKRNPSIYSVQIGLIDLTWYQTLDEIVTRISSEELPLEPDRFESGSRVDIGLYFKLNGKTDWVEVMNDIVVYQRTLQSASGVDIKDVSGISIKPISRDTIN